MNEIEAKRLASYIINYLNEEAERGNTDLDSFLLQDAINAYFGGADE
jgi:hypothetical protein